MRVSYEVVDRQTGEVVEGGFFSRGAAEACRDEYNCVETADSNRYFVRVSR